MFAVTIWRLTVAVILASIALELAIVVFGELLTQLLAKPPVLQSLSGLAAASVVLRIWSIGLLWRREFDLYVVSLTCWVGLIGIRDTDPIHTPSMIELALVLGFGLILDSVQVWALAKAVLRAKQKREPFTP